MPLILGAVIAVGLVSALLGDGLWNAVSWIALGIPLGVSAWFAAGRIPSRPGSG
jgi:hypothetical protein